MATSSINGLVKHFLQQLHRRKIYMHLTRRGIVGVEVRKICLLGRVFYEPPIQQEPKKIMIPAGMKKNRPGRINRRRL